MNRSPAGDPLSTLRILYVEDDLPARDEVAFLLENYIRRLWVASDGEEGLTLFREHRPDLVITDLQMPKMNGLEMIARIREEDPDIPIIITTAFNDSDYLFKAIELDVDAYETKPIDLKRLLNKLRRIAHRHRIEQENRRMQSLLQEYHNAIEESTYIVTLTDDRRIVGFNERLASMLGVLPDAFAGRELLEILRPESARGRESLQSAFAKRHEWNGEMHLLPKRLPSRSFRVTMIPMHHVSDEEVRYILFMQDITELVSYRRILQKELAKTRLSLEEKIHYLDQYQQVIDEATAVCCFREDGTIERTDTHFDKALEAAPGELVGTCYFDLCEGREEALQQAIDRAKSQNRAVELQTRCRKAEGPERIARTIIRPIRRLDGSLETIVAVHQDITELIRLNEEIKATQKEILYRLGEVAENHSKETGDHVRRVAEYSYLLARLIGLPEEESEVLYAAAPMHDIGKLAIPDAILNKKGPLTEEEFEVMKRHTTYGARMFGDSERPFMKAAAIVAAQHHENYDGSGYPEGRAGEEIHIFGRIVALADVFDALSVQRVYKDAWPLEDILRFIRENRGGKFDPRLVDLLFDNLDRFLQIRRTFVD